jgi:hypothetical protein
MAFLWFSCSDITFSMLLFYSRKTRSVTYWFSIYLWAMNFYLSTLSYLLVKASYLVSISINFSFKIVLSRIKHSYSLYLAILWSLLFSILLVSCWLIAVNFYLSFLYSASKRWFYFRRSWYFLYFFKKSSIY